jgi:hypothetical protein
MSTHTTVTTRAALSAIASPAAGDSAILGEAGREGVFTFDAANHSSGGIAVQNRSGTSVTAEAHDTYLVTKTGGTDNVYDAAATGAQALSGDYEIWSQSAGSGWWLFGADTTTPSSNGYADIDFAVSAGASEVYFYSNGASLTHVTMTSVGDWLGLVRSGSTLKVYENRLPRLAGARLLYTFTGTVTGNHYLKSTFYQSGTRARFIARDLSTAGNGAVAADSAQAIYVARSTDTTGASGAWVRRHDGSLSASWFGASPAATAAVNTDAFAAASYLLNWRGAGTLLLEPGAIYQVGHQQLGARPAGFSYAPDRILYFTAFDGAIEVDGRGATLRLADGLKYGSFDPSTGAAYYPSGAFYDATYHASPAEGVVFGESFSGALTVKNLTIDGNIANATIGGHYGDTGWQVMNAGLQLIDPGKVTLRNLEVHGIGTDGCTYQAAVPNKGSRAVPLVVENCRFECNGRQGFSLTGGRGATFVNCGFNHTGRSVANPLVAGPVDSNPHAGFDMEPDAGNYARDVAFVNCEFLNNTGAGYIADSGRVQDISFLRCRFSGDTNYALWFGKPGHVLRECVVVGVFIDNTVTDLSATYEEGRATQYIDCIFKDDPAWTFNGTSITGFYPSTAFSECCFERCNFDYTSGNFPLPESGANTVYRNCTLSQTKVGKSQTNAQFEGTTILTYSAGSPDNPTYRGRVILNGVEQFVASATVNWPSIAAGGSSSTTVTVPAARAGDNRVYLARMVAGTSGLVLSARPTADDTVTVTAVNPTSAAIDLASDTLKVVGLA